MPPMKGATGQGPDLQGLRITLQEQAVRMQELLSETPRDWILRTPD